MRAYRIAILALVCLGIAIAHSQQGHSHTHDHDHAHDHTHDHAAHDHDAHEQPHDHSAQHSHSHKESAAESSHGSGLLEKCTFFKDITKYIEENAPSKHAQVALSVLIISFPSVPIFLMLSFLGKIMRAKNEKSKFSSKLLNILLAFACGTILGDVMLHMLPYLLAGDHSHSHGSHGAPAASSSSTIHSTESNKPAACPFAGKSDTIPTDSLHAHLHDHTPSTPPTPSFESHSGHSHSLEQMTVPLMLIGGVLIFLVLDFAFMHVHSHDKDHDHDHSKKENKKKPSEVELKELDAKKQQKPAASAAATAKTETKKEKESSKAVAKKEDHGHEHPEEEHSAIPFLIGDFLHNFTDGIAVGAAYTVNLQMGVMSTLVIMIHELPHEIGDFAHLIKLNYSLKAILSTQFLTSLGALIGGFVGLATGEIYKKELLSITAGGFLYMCLTQVLPEILHELKKNHSWEHLISTICAMCTGVWLMYEVALME